MRGPGTDLLLLGLAASEERAFAALYDRFGSRLYRAALGMLGRPEDAEDAVQDVFMAMVRSRKSLTDVRELVGRLEQHFPDSQWTEEAKKLLEGGRR